MTIKLIVGLGNPGKNYQANRHNIGATFLDYIAQDLGQIFSINKNFFGEVASINIAGQKIYLLKPSTFMNHSGQSVRALMNFYKIKTQEILIIHDELDLPLTDIRLKNSGGHGGHNGLRDIITQLASGDFYRLRIGIGRPLSQIPVVDFVLQNFSNEQLILMNQAISNAYSILNEIIIGNQEIAMQYLHTKDKNGV